MPPLDITDIDTPVPDDILSGETDAAGGEGQGNGDAGAAAADAKANADAKQVEANGATADANGDGQQSAGEAGAESGQAAAEKPATEEQSGRAQVIPRARFDEVNAKLHAERERAEELARQLAEAKAIKDQAAAEKAADDAQAKIDELEAKHYDAILEGDKESALAIRREINQVIRADAERQAAERAERAIAERQKRDDEGRAAAEFESLVAETLTKYPFLDDASAEANAEAIADVVVWRDHFLGAGKSIAEALRLSVGKVAPLYAKSAAEPVPAKEDTRKKAAIERNAADAVSQPAAPVAGLGNRAAPPMPEVKTQADWEKLSEKEREALLS